MKGIWRFGGETENSLDIQSQLKLGAPSPEILLFEEEEKVGLILFLEV